MRYREVFLFQNQDDLWCWEHPVSGVRSSRELWTQESAQQDIDQHLAGGAREPSLYMRRVYFVNGASLSN